MKYCKPFVLLFLIFLINNNYVSATIPHPRKKIESKSGKYLIELPPTDSLRIVISNTESKTEVELKITDFEKDIFSPIEKAKYWTTGGSKWFKNSICFFDESENNFFIQLYNGKLVVINLKILTVYKNLPLELTKFYKK